VKQWAGLLNFPAVVVFAKAAALTGPAGPFVYKAYKKPDSRHYADTQRKLRQPSDKKRQK